MFVFSTYMKNSGSYLWLAQKLANAFNKIGKKAIVINDVINYRGNSYKDAIHVHFTTFNMLYSFLSSGARQRFGHTFVIADSVLPYHPLLQLDEWQKKYDFTLFTPSIVNYNRIHKFAKIRFFPHVVPVERIIPFENRKTYYIVGANELDYDRKGMWLAFWMKEMGFPVKAVCHNLCPPGFSVTNLSNDEMEKKWDDVKWYLALSHAETPHLPLIEAYLHGIPAFYHDATEFKYIGIGVPLTTGYPQIRSAKMMLTWEYNYDKLWSSLYKLYKFPEDLYRKVSFVIFEFARKWFGIDRMKDFERMENVEYNPFDLASNVEEIRMAINDDVW